jgi:DNA-binding CsgD family transcriptional regulator
MRGRKVEMSWVVPVSRLGEELAHARELAEAAGIVQNAVAALGIPRCEIVQPGEVASGRRSSIEVPVLGPSGVVATIACSGRMSRARERALVIIAMHLSVWWTNRGIDAAPTNDALTPRQLQVAQLAASGCTNAEIAAGLGISINTVKVRLKEAFDRLHVNNRTELASVLRAGSHA